MSPTQLPRVPFSSATAARQGISRHTLRALVEAKLVRRVTRDVYVAADVEDSLDLRARAVGLVISPHHVVCDRTAAWIWGVDTFSYAELGSVAVEAAAVRGARPCEREAVDSHSRDLSDRDVTVVAGVRLTTPLRTALDLGCILHRREALAALDAFRRQHGLGEHDLATEALRFAGRRGVVQLRSLIPLSDPRAESARESWTRLAIIDAGLPVPEPQVWIIVDGVPRYRLDLAYPHRRIAVEYDGWDAHERTPEQRRDDAERRDWLRRNGWTIIVLRSGDFTGVALERWLRELEAALRPSYSSRRPLERGDRITY